MLKFLKYTSIIFVFIGALNWGLVGFFEFDLVAFLFGSMTILTRIIYAFIGICAIVGAITCFIHSRHQICYED